MRRRSYARLLSAVLAVLLAGLFCSDSARGQLFVKYAGNVKDNTCTNFEDYADSTLFSRRFAHLSVSGIEGHLFLPTPANACSYIEPPPGGFVNSTWIALVYDYPSCPSDMVVNVRNAGYKLIIASSTNDSHRTVSNEVSDSLFPIAIVGEEYADYLKESVFNSTESILVHVEGSISLSILLVTVSSFTCSLYGSFCCFPCCYKCFTTYHLLQKITHYLRRKIVKKSLATDVLGTDNVTIKQSPIASAEDFKEAVLETFNLLSADQASAFSQLLSQYPELMATCCQQYPKFGVVVLHNACKKGWFDAVKMLVEVYSCNPSIIIYQPSIYTRTIWAFLLKACSVLPCLESSKVWKLYEKHLVKSLNFSNWTMIHSACRYGHLDIVKFLVKQGCDPACRSVLGITPLDFACWEGHLDVVKYLIRRRCNPAYTAVGLTPLHLACWQGHLDVVKFLRNYVKDIHSKCTNTAVLRLPPLHFACRKGKLDVVKLLLEQDIDPESRDRRNYTPLHIACEKGYLDIVKFLVNEKQCDHLQPTIKGSSVTPLYLAVFYRHTNVSSFLTSPGVSRQARAEYMSMRSVQPVFKIFVMGDPSVGKSTLVQAIDSKLTYNNNLFGFFTDQFRTISGVHPDTAGFNLTSICSKELGEIAIYDMAGQREYYSSHAALLERALAVTNSRPLLIVVVNLRESRDEIIQTLNYWHCFIKNHCCQSDGKSDIVIVGSHADVLKSHKQKPKVKATQILKSLPSSLQVSHEIIPLNCTRRGSDGLTELCDLIHDYCTLFQRNTTTDTNVNFLHALLCQEFKNVTALTVSVILSCVRNEWDAKYLPNTENRSDAETLSECLSTLSDKSQFLYLGSAQNVEESWMILDQERLLSEINGTLFAPKHFKEHYDDISSCTGVVPFSKIREIFVYPEMVINFMSHVEYCHYIPESEQALLISAGELRNILQRPEKLYFFPALVSIDHPEESYMSIEKTHCKSGWSSQCVRSEQFLPPRFLHVLLLRLAFLYAVAPEQVEQDKTWPVIQRRCNVWKSGIHWLNRGGVEAIVEVVEHNTAVTLVIGCLKGREMACIKHRSEVIGTILEVKKIFCEAVELRESFINPNQLSYPLKGLQLLPSFTITEIASVIAQEKNTATSKQGVCPTMCGIDDLLYFEPYACFNPKLLAKLFADENSNKVASDVFHFEADYVDRTKMNAFKKAAHLSPNSTYKDMKSALNMYSVFCGRNPLLLAGPVPSLQHSVGTASEVHACDQDEDLTTVPHRSEVQVHSSSQAEVLTVNELYDVLNELHEVRAKWRYLGGSLKVKESDLAVIRAECRDILLDCLREMLSHWLGQVDPQPCWNAIVAALRTPIVDEPQLAQTLEAKFCPAKPMAKPTREPLDQQDTTEDHSTVPHITNRPCLQELWCLKGRRGRVVKVVEAVAEEWEELAKTLHFNSSVIESVRESFPQPKDGCQEMLRRWLDRQEETCQPVYWNTLINSLREAGFVDIANDLQEAVENYPITVITTHL